MHGQYFVCVCHRDLENISCIFMYVVYRAIALLTYWKMMMHVRCVLFVLYYNICIDLLNNYIYFHRY